MAIRTELNVRLANSPGALAGVCRLLADEHVNITAMSLDTGGQLRLVVDNHVRAAGVLRERHHQVSERPVILAAMAAAAGGLAPILALLASAGVNVEYTYGSIAENARAAAVVIGVADPERAAAAAGV
jgi:hypothetical protein